MDYSNREEALYSGFYQDFIDERRRISLFLFFLRVITQSAVSVRTKERGSQRFTIERIVVNQGKTTVANSMAEEAAN